FGNLITNIPAHALPRTPWHLTISTSAPLADRAPLPSHRKKLTLAGVKTYSNVPPQTLAALVGSHGWVEIACNGGSAAQVLDISRIGSHGDLTSNGEIHISIFPETPSIQ
ncbi:MAG: SAM hydroxide adenosyltransferase, partial [Cyanobacteria bacterium J06598_3]